MTAESNLDKTLKIIKTNPTETPTITETPPEKKTMKEMLKPTGILIPQPPPKKIRTFKELMNADIPKVEYLVEDIIPRSGISICYGESSSFKTNFMLYLAIMGADGRKVLDYNVNRPIKTLWIDEENRDIGMKDKIINVYHGILEGCAPDGIVGFREPDSFEKNLVTSTMEFNLTDPNKLTELKEMILRHRPNIVVIDSISKIFRLNERDEKEVKLIYDALGPIVRDYSVSFVLIHHCRKRGEQQKYRTLEDLSGSRELGAMTDSAFLIEKVGPTKYTIQQTKNRYGKDHQKITFEVAGKYKYIQIIYKGKTKHIERKTEEKVADQILVWVKQFHMMKFKKAEMTSALAEFEYGEESIKNALNFLISKGCLKRGEKPKGTYVVLKTEYEHTIYRETTAPQENPDDEPEEEYPNVSLENSERPMEGEFIDDTDSVEEI